MTRRQGSRNLDFEETRASLLAALTRRLAEDGGTGASLRELASAAGVSTATLRHYFGDREGLHRALFDRGRELGAGFHLRLVNEPLQADVAASMRWALEWILTGFSIPTVRHIHTIGLRVALESPTLGPAYLRDLLEPLLQSVEVRIVRHQARGELPGRDPRILALQLVTPLFTAVLHQHALHGVRERPLDVNALIDALVTSLAVSPSA